MEAQFEKLGGVIRTFRVHAVSAKDARSAFSNEDALLLTRIREIEIEINIAKSEDLILKTLCSLGLERPSPDDQDDSTLSDLKITHYNSAVEMAALSKLPVKAASEVWAFKQITETHSIFEDVSRDSKSDEHFDEIQKLMSLLGITVQQLQELTETQENLNSEKIKTNQKLMKETRKFLEDVDSQRIELETKRNIDRDANLELMKKINAKLDKVNTTRMLINTLLMVSDINFHDKKYKPFIKLLKLIRNRISMDDLKTD